VGKYLNYCKTKHYLLIVITTIKKTLKMELEVLKAKLEELGKILLAEDGFFAQMPKEQLDAFGEAIKLMARIQTLEVLNEKLSNGFIAKIMPKIDDVSVMEPISTTNFGPMMTETHCPKCMAMPCMCVYTPMEPISTTNIESMNAEIPCPKCMAMPCMCVYTPMEPMMTETHCPKCMAMPCMCANQISANEFGSSDGLMGDMPMDFPEDTK